MRITNSRSIEHMLREKVDMIKGYFCMDVHNFLCIDPISNFPVLEKFGYMFVAEHITKLSFKYLIAV